MATVPDLATNTVAQATNTVGAISTGVISTAVIAMAASMCIVTANMVQARRFPVICPT